MAPAKGIFGPATCFNKERRVAADLPLVERDSLTTPFLSPSDGSCTDPTALASEANNRSRVRVETAIPYSQGVRQTASPRNPMPLLAGPTSIRRPLGVLTAKCFLHSLRRGGCPWAFVLCDQLIVSGTSFVTTILIGRVLGKHQLGLYVLAYSVLVVLLELQNSFIASPYTIKSPQLGPTAQARYTGSAIVLTVGLSAIAAVVLLSVGILFPSRSGVAEIRPLFLIVSLIAAPLLLKEFGRRACFAHFHVRQVLLLDALGSFIQLGGMLLLLYLGVRSVRSVYWLIAGASGIAAIVWLMSWRHRTVVSLSAAILTLRETWSFGMWVLTGNLAVVLSQQVYPWYLAWLRGPDATGAFAACTYLLALVNPLVTGVGNYLGPSTANASLHGARELSRVVRHASLLLFLVVGVFCLAVVLFGNRFLFLLYGSGYKVDTHILVLLAAGVLALNSTLAVGFGFWAIGRPDINLKINSLAVVLAVTAGPLLVRTYGLVGAACGLLLAASSVAALRVLFLKRVLDRR